MPNQKWTRQVGRNAARSMFDLWVVGGGGGGGEGGVSEGSGTVVEASLKFIESGRRRWSLSKRLTSQRGQTVKSVSHLGHHTSQVTPVCMLVDSDSNRVLGKEAPLISKLLNSPGHFSC